MKNKFIKISFSFLALLLMFSCESNDDYTGDSVVNATNPSLTVSLGFSNTETLIEKEASYAFTVSISEAQIADVIVNLVQTAGTATAGSDFSMPSSVTILKGTMSTTSEITIHSDELVEETETVTIQIGLGNESNVNSVASETVTFNIANLTDGDLVVGMDWNASSTVTDNYGKEIGAYDLGDLRLLLTDGTNILDGADGAVAETYTLVANAPDGVYYIVADFYDAMDIPADLDITLTFDQVGTMNNVTSTFPSAINTNFNCANNFVTLTKITKVGTNYTLSDVGVNNIDSQAVSWGGIDTYDYYAPDGWDSKITTGVDCGGKLIKGLNAEWMVNVWGESIESEALVYYTVDASGTITIPLQELFTTSWNGAPYDYQVSGTGTYDDSGDVPVIHLEYILQQDGWDVGDYWAGAGGMDTPYFVADLVAN
ncbi:Calx-beta domain-containing protein [uncultured Polaribacter sp.]|uniref:Calx-beta domain-containing protein n=1 Tax=uncultured Polaribacter sp. TaxID=174711 RepID=UPI003704D42B